MIHLLNTKPSWPAPPVIKKPKPGEKPKPQSTRLAPNHADVANDFCSPFNTPFVSPLDVMLNPADYRLTAQQQQEFMQQADMWLRCLEVPV